MSFLAPAALGFLALIPGIVLLYFLRLKRDVRVVSSTYLWKKTVDEFRVNRPFQKFQNHLLLWLQLLAIALLSLAAARPYADTRRDASSVHIVLLDHSASMNTREEGGRTRLELAKEFAREMARGLRSGDRLMLVGFSDRAHVAAPLTADRDALLRAVDDIGPTHRPTRADEAWLTALSVARQYDLSDVYLLSDGGFRALPQLTEANANVHFVPFGKSADNLGVVHLETRASEESRKRVEVFARIASVRPVETETLVELHRNGALVDAQRVRVPGAGERGVVFQRPSSDRGAIEVRIVEPDALAVDNRAWMALGSQDMVRVVLVGEEDVFLKQAIAMDPRVELTVIPPADYAAVKGKLADAELVVFDGVDPGPLARGSYLFLGRLPAIEGFAARGEIEQPALVKWEADHPLTQYINFSTLHVAKAVDLAQPPWMRTVLAGEKGAIIAAGERGGVRVAVVAFRVGDSDWPLRVSFPLFFANAVRWAKEEELTAHGAVRPGEPLVVRTPRDPQSGTIAPPDGAPAALPAGDADRVIVSDTDRPGVYRVKWEKRPAEALYAVSLTDPGETDVRVPEKIAMGETDLKGRAGSALVRREFWPWLLMGAIAVLFAEWLVYQYYRA